MIFSSKIREEIESEEPIKIESKELKVLTDSKDFKESRNSRSSTISKGIDSDSINKFASETNKEPSIKIEENNYNFASTKTINSNNTTSNKNTTSLNVTPTNVEKTKTKSNNTDIKYLLTDYPMLKK